jgi:hypothetical protein
MRSIPIVFQTQDLDVLASALGVAVTDLHAAILLARTGRADLLERVMAGQLGVRSALRMARGAQP